MRKPDRRAVMAGAVAPLLTPAALRAVTSPLGPGAAFGWAALDLATGRRRGEHSDLPLPMCSSFKWLLAACVLARVDAGRDGLDDRIRYGRADLLDYAPVTRAALETAGDGHAEMGVAALCDAAVTLSDNTAANLLLARIGGPAGLTAWLRAGGDAVTRLDRTEPALNHVPPSDRRDTTTPDAMVGELRRILFGTALSPGSRERLLGWMLGCKTGTARLPAGLPTGWRIAHKTGTYMPDPGHVRADRAASGDVGVLFPPRGGPILVAAYTAGSDRSQEDIDRWFAGVARGVVRTLG